MKKVLLSLISMMLCFVAVAQDPNQLIVTEKNGSQMIFNVDDVTDIMFDYVAPASVALTADSIGENSAWISTEMDEECKSFKMVILTAEEHDAFVNANANALKQYIDTVADTTYTKDLDRVEFKNFNLNDTNVFVVVALAYDENKFMGDLTELDIVFEESEEPGDEPGDEPVVPTFKVNVAISAITDSSATVTFTPTDTTVTYVTRFMAIDATYMNNCITNGIFDAPKALKYFASLNNDSENSHKGNYVFNATGLVEERPYIAIAYALGDTLNAYYADFSTYKKQVATEAFTFANGTIGENTAEITVTPNQAGAWHWTVLTKKAAENNNAPYATRYNSMFVVYSGLSDADNISFGQYLVNNSLNGTQKVVLTELEPGTDYVLCTFYVNPSAEDNTDFGTYNTYEMHEFKTAGEAVVPTAEGEVKIEILGVTKDANKYYVQVNLKAGSKVAKIEEHQMVEYNHPDYGKTYEKNGNDWNAITKFYGKVDLSTIDSQAIEKAKSTEGFTYDYNNNTTIYAYDIMASNYGKDLLYFIRVTDTDGKIQKFGAIISGDLIKNATTR